MKSLTLFLCNIKSTVIKKNVKTRCYFLKISFCTCCQKHWRQAQHIDMVFESKNCKLVMMTAVYCIIATLVLLTCHTKADNHDSILQKLEKRILVKLEEAIQVKLVSQVF